MPEDPHHEKLSLIGKPISGAIYLPSFDGLRGFAVMGVVLFHLTLTSEGSPTTGAAWDALPELLRGYLGSGYFVLDFLFVLSGFLMFLPIAARGSLGSLRAYAIRRGARLIPAYYVSLLVLLALLPLLSTLTTVGSPSPLDLLAHLTFLQREVLEPEAIGFGINGALWALSIDAIFYLTLPLFAIAYLRRPFLGLAIGIAISVAWRQLFVDDDIWVLAQFPLFAADHAIGMTAAYLLVRIKRSPNSDSRQGFAPWVAAAALAGMAVTMYVVGTNAPELAVLTESSATSIIVPACFGVLALSTAFLGTRAGWLLTNPVSRWLGDISYSTYLFHGIVLVLVIRLLSPTLDGSANAYLTMFGLVLPGTLAIAWLSFLAVERPARRWGVGITKRLQAERESTGRAPVKPGAQPPPA